jgi:hypothetical protein
MAIVVVVFATVIALSTLASGIDYFADCLGIDALLRGNLHDFFAQQPIQGSASLLLRAPFVALVFHSDIGTVYYAGLLPCYAALLALTVVLWRRMQGRPLVDRVIVAFLCAGSPMVVKAVHWGHPEDLLATALAVGALLAAARGRAVLAGAMLGTAYASKQWAVVAGLPILLALPRGHARFVLCSCGTAALFVVPMMLGDPARFWLVTHDASRAVPGLLLEHVHMPSTRVLPQSLWTPFATPGSWGGHGYRYATPLLQSTAHPLMVLIGIPLAYALYRRGPVDLMAAARLLALVLALRCALDPNDLDYYQVPVVTSLALLAVLGGERELRVALYATAGLSLAFVQPATKIDTVATHAWIKGSVYIATMVPLIWWLARELYGFRLGARRSSRSPRAQAATSSA